MKTKRCYVCGKTKPVSEFNKNKAHADGLQSPCRSCQKQLNNSYYAKNKLRIWGKYNKVNGRNLIVSLSDGMEPPSYAHEGDAAMDVRISEDVTLQPMERLIAATSLYVEIPEGYAGLLLPRSGLASKRGITLANAPALIDSGYRGEVGVALINLSGVVQYLERGDRVCQLMIIKYQHMNVIVKDKLSDSARGAGGFGSSGIK